jgi:hypothetical protein
MTLCLQLTDQQIPQGRVFPDKLMVTQLAQQILCNVMVQHPPTPLITTASQWPIF